MPCSFTIDSALSAKPFKETEAESYLIAQRKKISPLSHEELYGRFVSIAQDIIRCYETVVFQSVSGDEGDESEKLCFLHQILVAATKARASEAMRKSESLDEAIRFAAQFFEVPASTISSMLKQRRKIIADANASSF